VRRFLSPEIIAATACALLLPVPWVRVPAGFLLLFVLPGISVCRHWLQVRGPVRLTILGGLTSLCLMPALGIPAALAWGRPTTWMAAALAVLITSGAALRPIPQGARLPRLDRRHVFLLLVLALLLQIGMTVAKHPAPDTVRWKGLPDLFFFQGMYSQLTEATPPLDPENGDALLVHNWVYHFQFALLTLLTDLPIAVMMRIVSAWLAVLLLGIVYLLAADALGRPAAGVIAGLLLMASGEIYWVARVVVKMDTLTGHLPWSESPFGITLLFGWYNLAPLAVSMAALYWFARHEETGARRDLAASVLFCVVTSFFHPIFYAVFMTGFCLWLIQRTLHERVRVAWLWYLATPVPFFLLYKLPYYGLAMPPSVVSFDVTLSGMLGRAQDALLWGGIVLLLAVPALLHAGPRARPFVWIAGVSLGLKLLVVAPNPHWFNDLLYISLALLAGVGVLDLVRSYGRLAWVPAAGLIAVGGFAFALHFRSALNLEHTFSPDEYRAAAWLRSHSDPDDLIAILPNSPSSYSVLGLARRRLAHGWTTHLMDFHHDARDQERLMAELFISGQPERSVELARIFGIRYVYIGPHERGRAAPSSFPKECFRPAYAGDDVRILEFVCGDREEPPGLRRSASNGRSW